MLGNVPKRVNYQHNQTCKTNFVGSSWDKAAQRSMCCSSLTPRHQILFLITRVIPAAASHILGLCTFFAPHGEKVREGGAWKINWFKYEGNRGKKESKEAVDWEWKMCWFVSMGRMSQETSTGIHHERQIILQWYPSLLSVCVCGYTCGLRVANIHTHKVCLCRFFHDFVCLKILYHMDHVMHG